MKQKINKKLLFGFGMFLLIGIGLICAQINVCCEKTNAGAWCQNSLEENCDDSFRKTPTSCESTSFCKLGCCLDADEGLCMENTPQKVCEEQEGNWVDDAKCNVKQCELGCCILGTQASFVTQTRCKKLSGFFGLETNFKTNIGDELTCIAIATSQDQGACVFESDYQRTCRFTTRGECLGLEQQGNQTSTGEFFKDYLCSADDLATNCGPTRETICVDGKNEVYFKDTCGNRANIYDSNKVYERDASYWQKVVAKSDSCGFNDPNGNAGSRQCGNCDYFQGSICSKGSATYGDNVCNDLNCNVKIPGTDRNAKNGESWCVYQSNVGAGADAVGSRHSRHICFNGEELIEPCDDYRAKVCIQNEVTFGGSPFIEAGCRVNRWQTCMLQNEEDDCYNTDRRDCFWLEGARFIGLEQTSSASGQSSSGSDSQSFSATTPTFSATGNVVSPITGFASKKSEDSSGVQLGGNACVPNNPPGLKFWTESDAQSICEIGNSVCIVEYEKKLIGSKKCVKNCECLEEDYAQSMNNVCTSLGDCGAYVNIAGEFTDDGAKWSEGSISQGIMNQAKSKAGIK